MRSVVVAVAVDIYTTTSATGTCINSKGLHWQQQIPLDILPSFVDSLTPCLLVGCVLILCVDRVVRRVCCEKACCVRVY